MLTRSLAIVILAALPATTVLADAGDGRQVFSSGTGRVTVIELYTSEGCSSCPPADRWLSGLKTHSGLWRDVIPLAFHVDYWDYLGWSDRFAREAFSRRQRGYAVEGAVDSVYTPGVFRNGREWLGWRLDDPVTPDVRPDVGDLTVSLAGRGISLEFDPSDRSLADLDAYVAVIGMGLETRVRAGENAGRALQHDFVVLDWTSVHLDREGAVFRGQTELPQAHEPAGRTAVVAWVSERNGLAPIQAAGSWLRTGGTGPRSRQALDR